MLPVSSCASWKLLRWWYGCMDCNWDEIICSTIHANSPSHLFVMSTIFKECQPLQRQSCACHIQQLLIATRRGWLPLIFPTILLSYVGARIRYHFPWVKWLLPESAPWLRPWSMSSMCKKMLIYLRILDPFGPSCNSQFVRRLRTGKPIPISRRLENWRCFLKRDSSESWISKSFISFWFNLLVVA